MRVIAAVLMLTLGAGACMAQVDGDGPMRAFLDFFNLARVADADGAAEFLHEDAVFYLDTSEGLLDYDGLLDKIATDPPPETMDFAECEPEVYGDVAVLMAPLDLPDEDAPPFDLAAAAIMICEEGAWQLLALGFVVPGYPDTVPEEMLAEFDQFTTRLDALDTKLDAVYETGGVRELLSLCDPEAVVGGPYGEAGALETSRALHMQDAAADMDDLPVREIDGAETMKAIGPASVLYAVDATVEVDGTLRPGRHIVMAVYVAEHNEWRIAAAIEAPLGE